MLTSGERWFGRSIIQRRALALLVLSSVLVGAAWPAVLEQFSVRPNAIDREAESISRNIAATRQAFALNNVGVIPYAPQVASAAGNAAIPPQDVANSQATLNNIRMIQKHLNSSLKVSTIILTMYDGRTNLATQVADEVREHFSDEVLKTVIPRNKVENYAYSLKNQINDEEGLGGKIDDEDKETLKDAVKEIQDWLEENAATAASEDFDEQFQKLSDVAYPITSKPHCKPPKSCRPSTRSSSTRTCSTRRSLRCISSTASRPPLMAR